MEEQYHAWATALKRDQQQARRQLVDLDLSATDDLVVQMDAHKRDLFAAIRKHDVPRTLVIFEQILALRAQGLTQHWNSHGDDDQQHDLRAFQEDCVALATAVDHMLSQTEPV